MFSKITNILSLFIKVVGLFSLSSVFLVAHAQQQESKAELIIKPTKCVSLKQDQVCFVNVDITWRAPETGDYCVSSSQQTEPLQCWSSTQKGQLSQEIEMSKDVIFKLTNDAGDKVIVTTVLPLAWVYKKEKFSHSSWRIF